MIMKAQDKIHIGSLIRDRLKEDGRTTSWLAQRIQCKRRNIHDIFYRSSIDTALLYRICVAVKNNFFTHFFKICEIQINKTGCIASKVCYNELEEELNIGKLIKNKLVEEGRSAIWLSQKINCQRNNIYCIFNRSSIDTEQLLSICLALNTNFFEYYCEYYEKYVCKIMIQNGQLYDAI